MCDSKLSKMVSGVFGYFSTPTCGKALPGYAYSVNQLFAGIQLPDMITVLTLVYTAVLLIGALPGIWKTWDFFKARLMGKSEDGSKRGGDGEGRKS